MLSSRLIPLFEWGMVVSMVLGAEGTPSAVGALSRRCSGSLRRRARPLAAKGPGPRDQSSSYATGDRRGMELDGEQRRKIEAEVLAKVAADGWHLIDSYL